MAESVVGFLIKQLSTFLSQESTLLGGFRPDVQYIKDELGSMKAFLRQAEAKEDNDSQLQEWVKQVREVAYDTEDVLDDFAFRFARGHADGFIGRVGKIYNSIKNLKARHRISLEIKGIKDRVVEISARHQRYQSLYGNEERGSSSSNLVGIDQPKKELISKILDDDSHLKVVSVVGMGGLGKTTLVKKVYDDAVVKKQFQSHAWITVSQNFQFNIIIKDVIQQLYEEIRQPVPPQVESMNGIRLSEFVRDFLKERRYILVLDDVWSQNAWETIKCVLPDCNTASRVVLTTRIADVASASCLASHDFVHEMKPLSYEDSWTLFCNRTFQSNGCPSNLEEVSRKILKKCEGLPLGIVVIGGVLALKDKDRIDEWEMILRGFSSLNRLRSVEIFGYEDPLTTSFLSKFLCGGPKFLKVLNLTGAELDSIPKEVFKLFHLEYLDLGGTRVKIIPKSVGQLQNLESLNLAGTTITELPVEILKLRKLRTLLVGRVGDYSNNFALWGFKSPNGIGKLTSLESLGNIEVDGGKIVREIGKLIQLRELFITKLRREDGKELLYSLSRLTNLQELKICSIKEEDTLDLQHSVSPRLGFLMRLSLTGRLERVPEWVISLQSLGTLALVNSELSEDENAIGCLGHLPNLVHVTLYRAYDGETLCFKAGRFPKLQKLELGQLKRLKWVRVEDESMSSLQEFVIAGCKLMEGLPLGLQNLTKLKAFALLDMSDELIHKVQNLDKQSEDYQTISHITQVCIGHWINGKWKTKFL
ncbi:unnamed protein product [Coffea canephora]|uniref:Disease resistance protein RPM1-like n=1 Tax=Coffea canephora TaxID=49390 RepID=A0A068UU03_COFCA|nr:unnamed protein product [Coffea canephora]